MKNRGCDRPWWRLLEENLCFAGDEPQSFDYEEHYTQVVLRIRRVLRTEAEKNACIMHNHKMLCKCLQMHAGSCCIDKSPRNVCSNSEHILARRRLVGPGA